MDIRVCSILTYVAGCKVHSKNNLQMLHVCIIQCLCIFIAFFPSFAFVSAGLVVSLL